MWTQLETIISSIAIAAAHAHASPTEPDPHNQVDALISEAVNIHQDIQDASACCESLELSLVTLQSESDMLLSEGAEPAVGALLVLVNRIDALHLLVQSQKMSALTTYRDPSSLFADIEARAPLLNACKAQSRIVFDHFLSLSEKARDLTRQFTELATEFTFQISMAQGRMEKLQNMTQMAETLREGVERQRESWQGQKAVAELHIQQARETIRVVERKRDSMESARVVRNLLTFGLGEVFDFFDLNEEIEDAERTVASAEQNVRACEQSTQRAIDALQRISDEIASLGTFRDVVHTQEATLQASVIHGQALRTRTMDLTNASLDVSLFAGTLSARSEILATQHTAQEFARGVLSVGTLMVSELKLNELLAQSDLGALQETLDIIAQSDGENGTWEGGCSIEAQRPRFAIEDMM